MIRNGYSSDSLDFSQDEQFVATSHATTTRYVGFGSPQDVIQSVADHPYLVPIHWHPPALTSPHENSEHWQPVQGETQEYQQIQESFCENCDFTFQERDFEGYPEERLPVADVFDSTWAVRATAPHGMSEFFEGRSC